MLVCEQCGRSGELGMGWLHVVRLDVEDASDERLMVSYCPRCAETVFSRRRNVAHGDAGRSEASKDLIEVLNSRVDASQLERDRADDEEKHPLPD